MNQMYHSKNISTLGRENSFPLIINFLFSLNIFPFSTGQAQAPKYAPIRSK